MPVGPGSARKVAILGSGTSLQWAPIDDPSWEIWAHASIIQKIPLGTASVLIDLHPPHCFQEARKNAFKDYYGWLKTQTTPIYMQEKYPEIPASIRFPRERIKTEWPNVPVGSQTAWMIGLALMQGVTHLGFWGTHYAHESEYKAQRANTERWVGIAEGRGVIIVCPTDNPLCHEPAEDYAYESHNTPEKYAQKKVEFAETLNRTRFAAAGLVPCDTPEQLEAARILRRVKDPAWAAEIDQIHGEEIPEALIALERKQREDAEQS